MNLKIKIKKFFQKDIRTKTGLMFFIALLLCGYFFLQLMFGRANVFHLVRLNMQNNSQEKILNDLETEVAILTKKINLIKQKDKDYIDELLRKKLNRFPPNTYQIKNID